MKKIQKFLNYENYLKKLNNMYDMYIYGYVYSYKKMKAVENKKFINLNLQGRLGEDRLNKILVEIGMEPYNEATDSVHWLLFSCLKELNLHINNILEIGTYDGQTTLILSHLFPNAQITTIDLPESDPIFKNTYRRNDETKLTEYKKRQQHNLKRENINYLEVNSFFISEKIQDRFDLIWVDGGHLFPEISWDLCNAYHFLNRSGFLMCDDVVINKSGYRDDYVSPDSFQVFEYIKERITGEIAYFLKRNSKIWSSNPKKRKYIGVLIKD
jgi:predicted O-methyltransferase YrrM